MGSGASEQSLLLVLPDPCLLAVLQCCAAADDQRSLFSAARAHSRLHQAAVLALHSITAEVDWRAGNNVLLYLRKYGQHVDSVKISGRPGSTVLLPPLPPDLELSSLQLRGLRLQLQPGSGLVLGAAGLAALKQLHLSNCTLNVASGRRAKSAALSQLPAGLVHLSMCSVFEGKRDRDRVPVRFPTAVLQQLQQLTYLELAGISLRGPDQEQPALQPLQALTRLVDLRLSLGPADSICASMLSGTRHLTCLVLSHCTVEPAVLADRTQLQHLHLRTCQLAGGAAGEAQLLSHLQHLQQLSRLLLLWTFRPDEEGSPPAAAFAALTASSKLQQLVVCGCTLPAGVWQHMFPAGRQLPHLRELSCAWVTLANDDAHPAPEGSRLVSCCPCLQELDMQGLQYSTELLAPLQGLSRLHTLQLFPGHGSTGEPLEAVCQLTGLQTLALYSHSCATEAVLLQLTQLTWMTFDGQVNGQSTDFNLTSTGPHDEPVWRQLCNYVNTVLRVHDKP